MDNRSNKKRPVPRSIAHVQTLMHEPSERADKNIRESERSDCEYTYASKTGCQGRMRRGQRPGIVLERSRSEVKAKR